MKKIVLSLLSSSVLAVNSNAQIAIAPELGLNLSNLAIKSVNPAGGSGTVSTNMNAGLAAGAVVDLGITGNIYFQPGLFYEMTGASISDGTKQKFGINTIAVPLNFEYKTGLAGGNRFFVGIGPYIGYNVSGKVSWDADAVSGGPAGSRNLKIGSDNNLTSPPPADIKALDFGLGANLGYLLANGFYVRGHYQMGLTNLDPMDDAKNSIKSSAIGITVGYYLKAKKTHKDKAATKE